MKVTMDTSAIYTAIKTLAETHGVSENDVMKYVVKDIRTKMPRKVNKWVTHCKQFASENGLTYQQAVRSQECKNAYRSIDTESDCSSVITESKNPVVIETESPVVTESKNPVVTETESPVITETESPVITETESPVITETESPVITEEQIAEISVPADQYDRPLCYGRLVTHDLFKVISDVLTDDQKDIIGEWVQEREEIDMQKYNNARWLVNQDVSEEYLKIARERIEYHEFVYEIIRK
jgi:hypothetical protein